MHEVAMHGQDQSPVEEVHVGDCVQQVEPTEGTSLAVQLWHI